jgi:gliding motility-associated-like protein
MATAKTYTLTADEAIVGSNFTNVGMTDEVVTSGTLMGCFKYKNTVWYKVTLPTGFTNLKAVLTPTDPSKKLAIVMMSSNGATQIDAGIAPTVYQTTEVCATNPGQVITSTRADKCLPTSSKGYDVYIAVGSADVTNDESAFTLEMNAIKPTCSDGCKNQDETSVDAGGTCSSAACGTCATPTCAIFDNTTEQVSTNITNYPNSGCYNPSLPVKSKLTTSYKINSGASGTIGVKISERLVASSANPCSNTNQDAVDATRTYTLKLLSDPCPGTNILPILKNVANSMTGFNPEWQGLTVNTDYVLIVELDVSVSPNCALDEMCMVSYHPKSCNAKPGTFSGKVNGTPVSGNVFSLAPDEKLELSSNNDFVLPPQAGSDAAGIGYAVFSCDPSTLNLGDIKNFSSITQTCFKGFHYSSSYTDINDGTMANSGGVQAGGLTTFWMVPVTFDDACHPTKPSATCKTGTTAIGIDLNGDGCFLAGTPIKIKYVTSCAAKIGTTSVTINGATPPPGKNLLPNYYLLCKNDKIELKTTGFTLPPVGSGGTSGIGYMPYVCPPTPGKDPYTDACWASNDTYDILNPSSDINDGSIITQFPTAIKQTYYFVPITMDEALPNSMKYDENLDGCYETGTPIKVTYLKDIVLSKNEVCASSKVTISITGGAPEFVTGEQYRISSNIGTLSASTLTSSSGGTVDLTGLTNGDSYTVTVSDTTGCNKTITGTYSCTCTKPTITLNATPTEVCLGATTTSFTYTATTNSPDKYSITWIGAAITDGFVDISDVNLSTSPISVNIPSAATAQTYSGSLTVKNSTTGCTSTPQNISFVINGKPTITPTPNEVCLGVTTTSFAYSGITNSPNKYSITWNSTAITDGFVDITDANLSTSPISVNIPSAATAQTYTGSLTVKNSTTGCTSTAQNISFVINGNPTITIPSTPPIPAPFILEGKDSILSVSGGSGTGGAIAWKSSSPANATVVGLGVANQTAKVSGVLLGNTDIIYTDSKGCDDTVNIAISIPGCNAITKITSDQTWCQGIDPNALEFSTTETATDGISFVVFPATLRPITAADVYAGGVGIKKETPTLGKVSLDLPTLGSIVTGSLPVVIPGDYYVYGILNPPPSNTACRPYAEIKVTIKDTTSPLITIANTGTLNEYRVTWKDVPAAVSYKVDTVTYVKGTVPTTPNWKSLLSNITANHTLQAPLIFPNIPYGRTLLVQVTPLDVTGVKLTCNPIREKRIDNPNCTNPVLLPLNIPDTVCAGAPLDLLKGKINTSSVKVNFEWYVSKDSLIWTLLSSGGDFMISNTTPNEATDLAIKTKLLMNKSFVRLVGKDLATGQCSDTTLPVKIMVNEIPDATISIFPDPAKLCVGDPKSIEVTFQGSKGLQPYRFDFKLDLDKKDTTSASGPGDGKVLFPFNTNNPIEDSTFILDSITDKNGCTAKFTGKKVKLEVNPLPSLDFQADKTIGCYPLEVIFTDKSAATVLNTDVVWDFGNGDLDYTSLGVVKYIFQKSGDYTIRFKSTINGCWDTIQKTNYIHVKDRPEAQFSPKKTNISLIDPEIQFINSSSSNSVYYKWIFGDGSPVSNLVNPKHIYIGDGSNGLPDPGKYTVELYAYINQDCWDSTSTIITIDDEQIYYIPNTFTPNGDEKNNTFQPIFTSGYDAQNYHFLIYNRWGELIFESNNPVIGWDGTYGDKLLGNDTYTWKLQFKEKMTEKEHYLTGHVNLLK